MIEGDLGKFKDPFREVLGVLSGDPGKIKGPFKGVREVM